MRPTVEKNLFRLLVGIMALLTMAGPFVYKANALISELPNRSLKLSDSIVSHTAVAYTLGFDTDASAMLGSVELEICANDPFPSTSCTVPPGLDVSSANLVSQTGTNDFSIDVGITNAHRIVFSRTPSLVAPSTFSFEFDAVTNPSDVGTIYARIYTFTGSSMGGSIVNIAGLAFGLTGDLSVSTEVPPHIDLCVGVTVAEDCTSMIGDTVDFGQLKTDTTASGTSQFSSATNADFGYTVTLYGGTMTSGNNVIPPILTMINSTTGVNQFGINLRKNIVPNIGAEASGIGTASAIGSYAIPDNFMFRSGDVIASALGPDNYKKFTVTYIINIDSKQPSGFYASTVSFVAVGNF